MPIAFVTGATGLLGTNLVHQLVAAGWEVRALVRSLAKAKAQLGALEVELVVGDMERVQDFTARLEGADVLFHTAAYFRDSYKGGSHWPALYRINVEGTAALVAAAQSANVGRMVHVSSTATILPEPGEAATEDRRRRPEEAKDDYYRSKVLADLVVEEALAKNPKFWASFVLPGFMQGPHDLGPTAAGKMLIDFCEGNLPGIIDTNMAFVDARDVAAALIRAAESGERGRRYLAAGRTLHMSEVYKVMEEVTEVKAPRLRMPNWLLLSYAACSELWARISGRPVLLSWAGARSLLDEGPRAVFDSSRAVRELGISFRPLSESLRDSLGFYLEQGMIKGRAVTTLVAPEPRNMGLSI